MLNFFNLDKYKEYLISYYYYECDNNIISKEKRKNILETQFNDAFLLDVIHNTESFILILLERTIKSDRNFIDFELVGDPKHVFTNCTGGYSPDTLIPIFNDIDDNLISKYLLNEFLGPDFRVFFDADVEEILDIEDEDTIIGGIYYLPKITITGDFRLLQDRYIELKKHNELVRSLKRGRK